VPWYPKAILAIVAALVLLMALVRPFRQWAFRLDLRWLIGFHLIRFVGIYFLYLYAQRELPYSFAVWGGAGDILVAVLALLAIFLLGARPLVRVAPFIIAWNIFGLADIVAVATTAARSEIEVPGSMHQLDKFPLILLPTVIVPLVIVTHGLILARALRPNAQ
jgi:hypothetical protein